MRNWIPRSGGGEKLLKLRGADVDAMSMDDRAHASAAVVDLGVSRDGADQGARRHLHGHDVGLLEQWIERVANRLASKVVQAGSAGVTADGRMVGQAVVLGDFRCGAPAEEISFDAFAVRVLANTALTRMALGIGRRTIRGLPAALAARSYGLCARVGFEDGLCGLEVGRGHVMASLRC